ncbi:MAG TPA: hypothetical protein VHW44_06220 [Pseudonocardiaceae bacterium]|jgi:hypothetical protein|nr:hypothetical protein [Pseudonocardiaceae bacterium]
MGRPAFELHSNLVDVTGLTVDELGRSHDPELLRLVADVLSRTADPDHGVQRSQSLAAGQKGC